MTPHETRKAIFKNRGLVHELMLTENQVKIIRLTRDVATITSRRLSHFHHISVQNASMQLIKLYQKGYLTKQQVTSKTGGLENVFRSVV